MRPNSKKRIRSPAWEKGWKSKDQDRPEAQLRAICAVRPRPDVASGNLRRHRAKARVLRAQHRSPHVQLLTRTACVTDDGRDDRPALQQCKEVNDGKAKSHGRRDGLARRAKRGFTRTSIRRACLWNPATAQGDARAVAESTAR